MSEPTIPAATAPPAAVEADYCDCGKVRALCICGDEAPIDNRIALLVLQHPQEQDKDLGTARLAVKHLANAVFKIGLSWASLEKALGQPADPKDWAILHLGSVQADAFPPGRDMLVLDKAGAPLTDQNAALSGIKGIVVFDGTWSQAKTLWWRNAWVLKGKRVVIRPPEASLYGNLRREPRREGLSTIEAAGFVLARLEGRPEIETGLKGLFARMLARYREVNPKGPPRAAKPDYRNKKRFARRGKPGSAPPRKPAG
ncbi:MAG: DTW domain-containing protein [Hyphomicrobiaceae bacterium]|nr:DTW domain-containing protein [Hyphomicrobiaceae bacterium]